MTCLSGCLEGAGSGYIEAKPPPPHMSPMALILMAPGDNTIFVSAMEAGPLVAFPGLSVELSRVLTWQPTGGAQTPASKRPRLLAFTYSSEVGWSPLQPLSKQCVEEQLPPWKK